MIGDDVFRIDYDFFQSRVNVDFTVSDLNTITQCIGYSIQTFEEKIKEFDDKGDYLNANITRSQLDAAKTLYEKYVAIIQDSVRKELGIVE